jgi:hypothetical protein
MSNTSDSLEAQSDSLALKSFKYTMFTVWAFIIVAAYITINTEIPKKEAPPKDEHHGHDHH